MALKGAENVLIESVNVDKVKLKIHKVFDNNIVYLLNNNGRASDIGVDVIEKDLPLAGEHNTLTETTIGLKDLISNQRGIFHLNLESGKEDYYSSDDKLILNTDIGILAKQSSNNLLIWLNSLVDTAPVPNATVKVFSKTNQLICQGTSDENGVIHFKGLDFSADKKPFVVTASTDTDLSYLELEPNVLSEANFDIQGRPYLSSGYEAFVYTDRGVYRPGEKVFLRAIVRAPAITLPDQFPVTVSIKRPDGKEFKNLNGLLSDLGTLDLAVDIPDYATTGEYQADILVPGNDKPIGEAKFNVEEFIPDTLKVSVKIAADSYKLSDVIPLMVNVKESFGAAASGRNIDVSCKLNPVNFEPKGFKDFSFTDDSIKYKSEDIAVPDKTSDAKGQGYFEVELPSDLSVPSSLKATIKTVVSEVGGHAVTSYSDVKVYPYPFFIGVRKSADGFGKVNDATNFDLLTLLPDGTEKVVPQLKVKVCRIIWSNILKKDDKGIYNYVTDSHEEVVKDDVVNMNSARGGYSFIPKDWGDYVIRFTGTDTGSHTAALKFYVSGPFDSQPWAMEKPDQINLKFDRDNYAVGDTAKLLIQSPFKGKALIVCSAQSIVYTQSLELNALSQEVDIPVTQDFDPNAYCSTSVIRPLVYEENWSSHRAYGIAPLMLNHKANQLTVKVNASDKVEPGKTLKLDIDTAGESSELSVALVDDAILRLTSFNTPDPYEFFYGKRSNQIVAADIYSQLVPEIKDKKVAADSSPSGDRASHKHTNPVNAQRVKPVALWQTKIRTDQNGKATVQFVVPDFTGTLKFMVVAVGKSSFGSSDGQVRVVEPIVITPTAPRFLGMNDQFTVPVSVYNMTGKDGKIFVSMKASSGIELLGDMIIPIDVKNNSEGVVRFDLKSPSSPQKVDIKVAAQMGDINVNRIIEIPVRPAVPWSTVTGSGDIREGQKVVFRLPANWVKGTSSANLTIQALPILKMAGGLKFLLQYPYGCIEQTTSTVFPLLYLKDLATAVDSKKFNSEGVKNTINTGIERILSMQTLSGGFGWWPGDHDIYNWGSIYAMDFLLDADRAGFTVPQAAEVVGLDYLEKIVSGKDSDFLLQEKAYAVFVLAKGGRIKHSWIRKLQESLNNLPEYSRFHIAEALNLMGDRKASEDILSRGIDDAKVDSETGGDLNSYVRQQAIALIAYMDISPGSPNVLVIVKRLESSMQKGHWATTQENGTALIALGKYARYLSQNETDIKGSVSIDGIKKVDFNSQVGVKINERALIGHDIAIEVSGKGVMYYSWSVDGVPAVDKVDEKDSGLVVRRVFLTKEGKPADLSKIKQGDVLVADITIEPKGEANNMVIEDLLPAGFEIENPRLKTSEQLDWVKGDSVQTRHMDMRDDRLVIFTDVKDTQHYRYVVRAVTVGDFILPAIRAELMYSPNINSTSGQGRVKVVQ
jgi:uncharacterized protein YfaS (alpha-2-macroglobulin family)